MSKITEKLPDNGEAGFGLIETVFAMVIFVFGTLAALGLISEAIRIQSVARSTTEAAGAARRQIERVAARPRAQRIAGGNLNSNVTGYNEAIASGTDTTKFLSRWEIEDSGTGVPTGMQRVTVQVTSTRVGVLPTPVTVRMLIR